MDVSVIIVSYNVRPFLEKCLESVLRSRGGLDVEVIVVDNRSLDDSVAFVKEAFPEVTLIANEENVGFGRANNQGFAIAKGRYTLILNPDTLVNEDTIATCFDFMEQHEDAGAIGVKMLDGTGRYLPESKRGLPSPRNAFFKMTGINTVFPESNVFNGYYMGGLDSEATNPVPVLTGAFMFCQTAVLRKLKGFDEDYFMYGEDIDLSFRFLKLGYQNYYVPETTIIHYKGESTKRSSLEYVKTFYNAMLIFVSKHYSGVKGFFLKQFLKLGILFRAALSTLQRILSTIVTPSIDILIIVFSILGVKWLWSEYYFDDLNHFDASFNTVNLPLYAGLWMVGLALFGNYSKWRSARTIIGGMILGTIMILIGYALLPEGLRSSRAVIMIAVPAITAFMILWTHLSRWVSGADEQRKILIVGAGPEVARIMELMNRIDPDVTIIGAVSSEDSYDDQIFLADHSRLREIIEEYGAGEVVFSAVDIEFNQISRWMAELGPVVSYRVASEHSDEIIGSDSKHSSARLHTSRVEFAIDDERRRRSKRTFDIIFSFCVMLVSPLRIFNGGWRDTIRRARLVLNGSYTWVAYDERDRRISELPKIRPGILSPGSRRKILIDSDEALHTLNYLYAREYSLWKDIEIVLTS